MDGEVVGAQKEQLGMYLKLGALDDEIDPPLLSPETPLVSSRGAVFCFSATNNNGGAADAKISVLTTLLYYENAPPPMHSA
ncbi:hypothetical protein TIFTF001_026364 [Ficus carica]|uniref:Uncharacterized protein n=1 Tax=Ficus carica TaxID=3494 RepID=A0AA88IYK6_FICCA|nr:hypothetical protein TIFTF001_026364 [Ficus carica]